MITSNISNAVDALNQGDLVAIPTETVYGLAGSAFNEQAIHKTFQLKISPRKKQIVLFLFVLKSIGPHSFSLRHQLFLIFSILQGAL